MSFRAAKPKQDNATPHLQSPPLWEHPQLRMSADKLEKLVSQHKMNTRKAGARFWAWNRLKKLARAVIKACKTKPIQYFEGTPRLDRDSLKNWLKPPTNK